ncbi:MAG: hypothetical protein J0I56_00590 [Novosphingobium sp.]|nr:hypothetical protein [Novosphingobium sp.]
MTSLIYVGVQAGGVAPPNVVKLAVVALLAGYTLFGAADFGLWPQTHICGNDGLL